MHWEGKNMYHCFLSILMFYYVTSNSGSLYWLEHLPLYLYALHGAMYMFVSMITPADCQPPASIAASMIFMFASTASLHHCWQDNSHCHPACQKYCTTLNPQCSHSLVLQIRQQTFPRWRLCPAPRSSLVICCLGCRDSLDSHTPSSPYNSSRTTQHTSFSASPDPPMLSPSYSSSTGCFNGIQNPAFCGWQTKLQRDPPVHNTRPLSRPPPTHTHIHKHTPTCSVTTVTTGHSSSLAWLLLQWFLMASSLLLPLPLSNFCNISCILSVFIS